MGDGWSVVNDVTGVGVVGGGEGQVVEWVGVGKVND